MAEEKKKGLPEDIKASLVKLASSTKTEPKEIMRQMKDIMENDPQVKNMSNEKHKIRFAHIILVRRYSMTGGAKAMYLRPLSKPRSRLVTTKGTKKYVGNLAALVQIIDKDKEGKEVLGDVTYAAGTLWEKAAEKIPTLDTDKVYRTSLKTFEKNGGLELGGNDALFTEVKEIEIPTAQEYFDSHIKSSIAGKLVSVDDIKINVADDQTDIRIIKGAVLESTIGTSDKMGEYGLYSIMDDSLIGKDNFPIWVHPSEVIYGASSELYFIGICSYDESKDARRFDCHFIVPAGFTLSKDEEPKPVEATEEVDMDDIADELEELEEVEASDKDIANVKEDDEFAL